jgi:hypothetical protein
VLIQIDGSPHDWFEGRGLRHTLIVFIDDTTGRLTALRFVPAETTRAYLETPWTHVLAHGAPQAFYSDRHGIFRVNAMDAASGDGKTEFGRVSEAGHRAGPCADTAGEGSGGASQPNVAGSSGEGEASTKHLFDGGSEWVFA